MASARCAVCGREEFLPFRCKLCAAPHCLDHRLPENHGCPGLGDYRSRVREDRAAQVRGEREVRVRGPSPLAHAVSQASTYLRRSATHLLLGAIVAVFAFQIIAGIVVGLATGIGVGAGFNLVTCSLALGACGPFLAEPWALTQKPWTLLTNLFTHGGTGSPVLDFMHFFFNVLFLYFFGLEMERRVGRKTLLQLFFAGGILAAIAQVVIFGGAVAGASGGLMALLGTLTVLAPTMRIIFYFVPAPLWVLTGFFVVFDVLGVFGSPGGVARAAHLVGLALGLAYGLHLKRRGVLPRVQSTWASQRRW